MLLHTNFFKVIAIGSLVSMTAFAQETRLYLTVEGEVRSRDLGVVLSHEHVLVDFIGAEKASKDRYKESEAFEVILPHLNQVKSLGCEAFVECTPNYIGRDVLLLKRLSEATGLKILTNTGYYGARQNLFLPGHAFSESAEELAQRWVTEFQTGIEGTGIRPGFIKVGVDGATLSELHKKLVRAAALTHAQTGLVIASHTGQARLAFEQLQILENNQIPAEAFIWVHAQAERDVDQYRIAATRGCWVSLDGYSPQDLDRYVSVLSEARNQGWLNKVLISHDAGWYSPGEVNGGRFRGYNAVFQSLVPGLSAKGFTQKDLDLLLRSNPGDAFQVKVRK